MDGDIPRASAVRGIDRLLAGDHAADAGRELHPQLHRRAVAQDAGGFHDPSGLRRFREGVPSADGGAVFRRVGELPFRHEPRGSVPDPDDLFHCVSPHFFHLVFRFVEEYAGRAGNMRRREKTSGAGRDGGVYKISGKSLAFSSGLW